MRQFFHLKFRNQKSLGGLGDVFEGSGRSFGAFDFSGSGFGSGEGRSLLDVVVTDGSGSSDDGSADAYQSIHETHMASVVTIDKLFQGNVKLHQTY